MKKLLSVIVVIAFSLCMVNSCSALSIEQAVFVRSIETYCTIPNHSEPFRSLDLYLDLSDESGIWEYPSGQQILIFTTFYVEPKTKTIMEKKFSVWGPRVFEFIKDKKGTWGFSISPGYTPRNKKGIITSRSKIDDVRGFFPVVKEYDTFHNNFPLTVLKKIGEYIDLDSFPSIN